MPTVSVIVPSRNEVYLQKTVSDLLTKAKGEIEVIVVLDGYWPIPPLKDDERLKIIHRGSPRGMRAAINAGAALAKGKFLMKTDAHCQFAKGFDTILAADCQENWVMVPRRYALDPEKWQIIDNPKYPIDYMYLSSDLHGVVWEEKNKDENLKDKLIDETMSNQGSVWFMPRIYFEQLELMDEETYGTFWNEFQEIGLKCWLSGGRVMVDKKTWYAHWHKTDGRGYSLSGNEQPHALAAVEKWKIKGWHKQTLPLSWLVDHFKPVPTWAQSDPQSNEKRIKNRNELAQYFNQLSLKVGAEIGVSDGINAENLCKNIDGLKLYCIDPWAGEQMENALKKARERLNKFKVTFIQKSSLEAVRDFKDGSLDFVFIDANHKFDSVMEDIIQWSKKVRRGGIVSGHDYYHSPSGGIDVIEAVDAYTKAHGLKLNLTAKDPDSADDKEPSFWWVKP